MSSPAGNPQVPAEAAAPDVPVAKGKGKGKDKANVTVAPGSDSSSESGSVSVSGSGDKEVSSCRRWTEEEKFDFRKATRESTGVEAARAAGPSKNKKGKVADDKDAVQKKPK